ncbi:MAG TPA: sulfite exporter TauE/SafE family protein [Gemmatimonadales bacterium]|nr:sulfite exporter TauE/SafE family protein [Gemmatimonadales bacterium]
MNYLIVSIIGLVAGVVSGLFGIGGAILIVPALVLIVKLDQHTANGTSLAALLLPVGFLGALQYYRQGKINIPYALIIAAGLFLGAYVGARLAVGLPDTTLRKAFGGLLFVVSVKLLLS